MARNGFFKGLFGAGVRDELRVACPISGTAVPLAAVPDEAFSQKMMGDGVAVLPSEGIVASPFDGTVETVPESRHAVGLRSNGGLEILIHVGIETVSLGGKHFSVRVAEGDRVKAGDVLIEFDLEAVKAAGFRTETPVVVVNGDEFAGLEALAEAGSSVRRGDPLLSVPRRAK